MRADKTYKIISIDPSRSPSGVVDPEMTLRFMRRRGIVQSVKEQQNSLMADVVFGTSASRFASKMLLGARLVVSGLLIAGAIMSLTVTGFDGMSAGISIVSILGSILIASGLFERLVAATGSVICLVSLFISPSIICGLLLVSLLLLAICGPGRFSVDRALQRQLKKHLLNRSERSLDDYRAFSRL